LGCVVAGFAEGFAEFALAPEVLEEFSEEVPVEASLAGPFKAASPETGF
jgi:hypothetical protein